MGPFLNVFMDMGIVLASALAKQKKLNNEIWRGTTP